MNVKCFLDSNIIIYAHTDLDLQKQQIAQQLVTLNDTTVSTQVLQESANILIKKFQFPWSDIQTVLKEVSSNNHLHTNSISTIQDACRVANQYGFSFYDSLIIAAALETGAVVLYSEDLQNGQIIDLALTVKNPF